MMMALRLLVLLITFGTISTVSAARQQSSSTSAAIEKRLAKYDQRLGPTYNDTYRAAARIQLAKPICELEAFALSSAYFSAYINGCGGPEMPRDKGDRWVAGTTQGFGEVQGPQIIVERKTGMTYSPGRSKLKDPKIYLKFIPKHLTRRSSRG